MPLVLQILHTQEIAKSRKLAYTRPFSSKLELWMMYRRLEQPTGRQGYAEL